MIYALCYILGFWIGIAVMQLDDHDGGSPVTFIFAFTAIVATVYILGVLLLTGIGVYLGH